MAEVRFIGVARDGSMTDLITVGQMIAARDTLAGFWRVWPKEIEQELQRQGVAAASQGGGEFLLSPPLPAALVTQPEGSERIASEEPSGSQREAASEPVADSNVAGSGVKKRRDVSGRIMQFLQDAADKGEHLPNGRAITDHLGWSSIGAMRNALGRMEDSGIISIQKPGGKACAITIISTGQTLYSKNWPHPASSPSLPRQREAKDHEAVQTEESTLGEDRFAPEGVGESGGSTAPAETPESQPVHVNPVTAEAAAERVAPVSQPAVAAKPIHIPAKPKPTTPRDWITQRKDEIVGAISYLKTHNIAVSVSNPHAEIKMFRLSDRGGQRYHESVIDAARELGWEGLV